MFLLSRCVGGVTWLQPPEWKAVAAMAWIRAVPARSDEMCTGRKSGETLCRPEVGERPSRPGIRGGAAEIHDLSDESVAAALIDKRYPAHSRGKSLADPVCYRSSFVLL